MKITAYSLFLIYFLIGFQPLENSFAGSADDFYIHQALERYFPLPSDARSLATGGSTDANCRGAICTFLNPAGLGRVSRYEVSAAISSHRVNGNEFLTDDTIEQSEKRGHVLLAMPLGENKETMPAYGALSLGYSRYQGETNDSISSTPDGHRRTLGYGYNFTKALGLGYTFTFYDDQLNSLVADLHSHARILHLFGTQYALDENTTVGATFKLGLGQSDTEDFEKRSDGLSKPREYAGAVGITKKIGKFQPSLAFDYSQVSSKGSLSNVSPEVVIGSDENGKVFSLRSGLEHSFTENFTARSGVRWYEVSEYEFHRSDLSDLNGKISGVGWSGGIGYVFNRLENGDSGLSLDYGVDYLTAADGEWEHRISIAVPFDSA